MQVSLEWLNEYVDIKDLSPEEIAHGLTMSGLECEGIDRIGAKFTNIKVVEIQKIDNHPNADKLHLVTVFDGTSQKIVVCGAQNIEVGQKVPYASVGSTVLDRKTGESFQLTPAVIRGVESQGMLCSDDELGVADLKLQEEDGILILNRIFDNVTVGADVKDVLNLPEDTVLHVAPTANRGDEMSVVGIAREVATIFSRELKFSPMSCTNEIKAPNFEVKIDENVCKYYSVAVLKDLKVAPSPAWMQRRLLASGVRAISNIVDVTNYVMLEYGQPLHSFDLDKLNGYLEVRTAKEGETITTLDGEERQLNNNSVLIATKEGGVALAGVMGGENSEIDDNTKNIALEAAFFPAASTRRCAKSVGLRTEANARFERGVDMEMVKPALIRAIQLLVELCGAKFEGIAQAGNNALPEQLITLRYAQIKRYLGIDIPEETCISILSSLGFKLCGKNQLAARFSVPGFRAVDVTREIDLIEEIARIHGYDKIEPTLPDKTVAAEVKKEDLTVKKLCNLLLGKGFYEAMTSSLIGKPLYDWAGIKYDEAKNVEVCYSQSEDFCMLRQSVIPSLLNIIKYNFDNGSKNLRFFENAKTYTIEEPATEKTTGVKEKRILCGLITGNANTSNWQETEDVDFYTLKGVIENIFEELKLTQRVIYSPCEDVNYLHPKRSAYAAVLGKNKAPVAKFGQLHPVIKDRMKFNQDVFFFEIDLDALLENVNYNAVLVKELPVYPEVTRDIAFIVKNDVSYQDLAKSIKKFVSPNLFNGADIFDVYQGEHVEEGHKSVAFHIYLQDKSATLTDQIIDTEINKIKDGLKKFYSSVTFRE
ncbi:MAG: phenylalanine--tRNA ligase subunit beta [bacterium]|nr:phenylalanine--tRNA ligase subunit beta [bacterium]